MRLIEVNFSGRHDTPYKPTPEELTLLNVALVYGPEITVDKDGSLSYWQDYLMDAELMPYVPHTVKRVVVNRSEHPLGLDTNTATRGVVINQKVNVAVPGLGLMMINTVRVVENSCTENLQGYLEQGWRILAICPQPDQRRPDYVLGLVKQPTE